MAIQDYNDLFGRSVDTSADKFQNSYKTCHSGSSSVRSAS